MPVRYPSRSSLGATLTGGQGAGSLPDVGRNAAIETLDEIKGSDRHEDTSMVFITAGMGGGTGTGCCARHYRASRARNGHFDGRDRDHSLSSSKDDARGDQAAEGTAERMRESVDTLLIIRNDKIA